MWSHGATILMYVAMSLALANGGKVYVDDVERATYWREACDKLLDLGTTHGQAAVSDAQAACKTLDFSFLDIEEDKRELLSSRKRELNIPSNANMLLEETSMLGKRKKKKEEEERGGNF